MGSLTQRLGVKTAWISDLHLGSPHTRDVDMLNTFLRLVSPKQLYLLGDSIDGYDLAKAPCWTHGFEEALQRLYWLPTVGTEVTKIPGNHDGPLRQLLRAAGIGPYDRENHLLLRPRKAPELNGSGVGIKLMQSAVFTNKEGSHLFLHGDENEHLDPAKHKLVELYDAAYYRLAHLTPAFNRLRGAMNKPYLPLTQGFQDIVCKRVTNFVREFEEAQVVSAMNANMQGVFCGHIHYPANKVIEGIHYRNPGSMQVDQTLMIENARGEIKQVNWGTVCLKLRKAQKQGRGIENVLDELADKIGAERLTATPLFSYRNPGVDEISGQLRSTQAGLIATATFGPNYRQMPVQPAL